MFYVFTIKFLRKDRNISLRRLSKMSNVSRPYLSNLEANRRLNPSIDTLSKIADALGVDIKDLFYSELELEKLKKVLNKRVVKYGLRSRKVLEISRVVDLLVNLEMRERMKNQKELAALKNKASV